MKSKKNLGQMHYEDLLLEYERVVKYNHYDPFCQFSEDDFHDIDDLRDEILKRLKMASEGGEVD